MIDFKTVKSGSLVGKFKDRYGAKCSIQESSYQDELCIWLGVEVDHMGEDVPNGRMHLTQEQARDVAEALLHFANEGSLGKYDANQHFRVGSWVRGIGKDNFGMYGRIIVAHVGSYLAVQDQSTPGDKGQITCAWDSVGQLWSPADPPPEGRTLYERILDDEED